jgi:AbrB family transcriptional regulator (stage V sporulation protein T)
MRAMGTVRRIDNLGRIVIPKEVRNNLRIREGDSLEILVDHEGEVILKKYSHIGGIEDMAKEYADSLHEVLGHIACITDREQIVAVAGGPKKYFLNKRIGSAVIKAMEERKAVIIEQSAQGAGDFKILMEEGEERIYSEVAIAPIIADSQLLGSVIIASRGNNNKFGDLELNSAVTAASILAKQM